MLGKLAGYVLSIGEYCFTTFRLSIDSEIHRAEFQICLNIVSIAFLVEMVEDLSNVLITDSQFG